MRLIKMFGFAALAAAVMAVAGTTSASAVTTLEKVVVCKNHNTTPCSSSFGSGTVLHGELEPGTEAVLLTSLGNVECAESKVLGTTISSLAHGEITAVALTGCVLGESICLVTMEHLNYLVKGELDPNDIELGLLVTEKGTNGKPRAHVVCGFLMDCKFGASTVAFTGVLETNDEVFRVLQELEREGGFCPATSTWHAKYLLRCLEGTSLVGCWLRME